MKFRFETLLKLRKNVEDLVQKDFAAANRHLLSQQQRLGFMNKVKGGSKQNLTSKTKETIDVNIMFLYNNFFNGIHVQEKLQERIISEISPKVEAKRKALTEAMRKRKTLEILKERDQLVWRQKRAKQEMALLDEAASNQWRKTVMGFGLKIVVVLFVLIQASVFDVEIAIAQKKQPKFTPKQTEKALKEAREAAPVKTPQARPINLETLRMMEKIEQKTKELKKREENVQAKEHQLKILGEKVKADLNEIQQTLRKTQELMGMSKDISEKKMAALVKIYSAMPVPSIAPLIEELDEKLAVQIISRMKSKIAGQVLGQLDPKIAKSISEKIIGKKLLEQVE